MNFQRTLILATAMLTLSVSSTALARNSVDPVPHDEPQFNNVAYVNPFLLAIGGLGVGYERGLGEKTSLLVSAEGYKGRVSHEGEHLGWMGGSVTVQPHYYFRSVLEGGYVAPFARVSYTELEVNTADSQLQAGGAGLAGGATIGWSWNVFKRVNIKLGAGPELSYNEIRELGGQSAAEQAEQKLDVGFNTELKIGFAF